MKTAIIIHGMPSMEEYFSIERVKSPSNNHWFPWIQLQLLQKNVLAQTPEMPKPYEPEYEAWKKTFEQFNVDEETILVGHSCGGGFIIRWLSENKVRVGKVILVAPWLDPEKYLTTGMFDFEIDSDFALRTDGVTVMYSTDDEDYILDTINLLKEKANNIIYQEFSDKGHFCLDDLGTEEFSELLENIFTENNL